MGQLNQFGADGKLATKVPLRPRAAHLGVRGPDVSGTRAVSGKQRNFRSSAPAPKQKPGAGRAGAAPSAIAHSVCNWEKAGRGGGGGRGLHDAGMVLAWCWHGAGTVL